MFGNLDLDKRISFKEGISILKNAPLNELGVAANEAKERRHGKRVTYIKNMHLNVTNICINRCRFCSFKKRKDEEGAYALSIADAVNLVRKAASEGIREIHLVNALNPELDLSYYVRLIKTLKQEFPDVTVKGLTAVEIDFLAKISSTSYENVIDSLIEAGVELFPGGGAEIFSPRVRKLLGTSKTPGTTYLEIHKLIHKRGIKSNATMLYGHFETEEEIVDHLEALRRLQDETGGFSAFIPLRFVSKNTPLKVKEKGSPYDLLMISFSRIYLDNFEHIKAYWVSLTPEVAQVAINYGADDFDGTIYKENIIRAAGAQVKPSLSEEEIKTLIQDAGCMPVERDSHFNQVKIS